MDVKLRALEQYPPGVADRGGRLNSFKRKRTLTEYPTGEYRWTLLLLTVLAVVLISYEFQLAPILSLLLPYLHMSKIGYGYFVAAATVISAVSAFYGGPLADRYGRVVIIDLCLAVITVMVFANLLIVGIKSFLVIRITMSIVAGMMAGAGAALVRDMSPRLSRALAFGLLTIGPVGSNFLANYIAGITLPIYRSWESQMWIMGFIAIAMYVPILIFLKDLSPELRMRIYRTEMAEVEAAGGKVAIAAELPGSAREAFATLLKHFEPWLMVVPFTISLALYIAIQAFGPLMFTESFHYTPGDAAAKCAKFWLGNIGALIVVGLISDKLQMRKPIAVLGAILTSALLVWWIPTFGEALPRHTMSIVATTLGCFLAILSVPWAAQYSEALEEISPALQATGWAFYGLVTRAWAAISVPLMLFVAVKYGWAAWIKFSLVAFAFYAVAMLFTHPTTVPTRATRPKPKAKPQPATA
jgi:OPA family glycerol-3-phosphate transporter-like MFS transporter